jgi:hypothetical protein
MKTRSILALLVCSLVACEPPPAAAPTDAKPPAATEPAATTPVAEAPLPAAEAVLQASIDALGGNEKIASLKSFYKESTTDIPAQSLKATNKMWWKAGNFYMEVDMPGVGTTRVWKNAQGIFGEDPINGRRKFEGAEARQAEWSATPFLVAEWKKFFETATTKARRDVNGRKLVDVVLAAQDGTELTLSFDEATHDLVEQSFVQESPMGKLPVKGTVVETKDFGGYKMATKTQTSMAIISATDVVTKFEPNVEIEDSKFDPDGAKGKPAKVKTKAAKPKPAAKGG